MLSQLSYTPIDIGSHLLSPIVSNRVSSAVQVLTFVFGMGTGVSPARIATKCFLFPCFSLSALWQTNSNVTLTSNESVRLPLRLCRFLRKEVIQPHLPIRLPCYDFTPVTRPAFGDSFLSVRSSTSGISDSHGVTGGVYKTRERIHRDILIRDY